MTDRRDVRGLPSPSYYKAIAEGFANWQLPLEELKRALLETREEHLRLGIHRYERLGRKRLMAAGVRRSTDRPRNGRVRFRTDDATHHL